jgi:Zn-finger protein
MDDSTSVTARPLHSCTLCACPRTPGDVRGLAWSSHHVDGVISWVCGPCTRAHLFEIETGQAIRPASLARSA